ncbi:MAG TPA: hypothetical protein VLD39_01930, partial [Gammaproteobacteria bacterium]|nr:hypothetical protein [Gammaproteobacteria bacterium]
MIEKLRISCIKSGYRGRRWRTANGGGLYRGEGRRVSNLSNFDRDRLQSRDSAAQRRRDGRAHVAQVLDSGRPSARSDLPQQATNTLRVQSVRTHEFAVSKEYRNALAISFEQQRIRIDVDD